MQLMLLMLGIRDHYYSKGRRIFCLVRLMWLCLHLVLKGERLSDTLWSCVCIFLHRSSHFSQSQSPLSYRREIIQLTMLVRPAESSSCCC